MNYTQLAIASLIEAIKEHKLLISNTIIVETFREFHMKIARRPANTSRRELGFKARLTVTDYLKQYLSTLHEQNPELEYRAKECFELAKLKRKFQGSSPRSFAVAILFISPAVPCIGAFIELFSHWLEYLFNQIRLPNTVST